MANNWYVSSLASGGENGQSEETAWTLAEAVTNINNSTVGNGDTVWLKADGTYTTTGITITRFAVVGDWITLSGYNSVIEDGGNATIQKSSGTSTFLDNQSARYYHCHNFIFDGNNLEGFGVYRNGYWFFRNCELKNFAGASYLEYGYYVNCYFHDNTGYNYRANFMYCLFVNCDGIFNGIGGLLLRCIVKNCGVVARHYIIDSIIDVAGKETNAIQPDQNYYTFNTIIMGVPAGKYGIYFGYDSPGAFNINFYNCDGDYANDMTKLHTYYELDPQFKDPDNLDYTRTGTNLDDLGFGEIGMSGVDYNIDIGIDQKITPDFPSEDDVENGVDFDNGNKTGNLQVPSENDVEDGVGFGSNGTEKEGNLEVPAGSDVRNGTGYGSNGIERIGSLEPQTFNLPIDVTINTNDLNIEVEINQVELGVTVGD